MILAMNISQVCHRTLILLLLSSLAAAASTDSITGGAGGGGFRGGGGGTEDLRKTRISDLVNIFDPYRLHALARQQDLAALLKPNCRKDVQHFLQGLDDGAVWASKMYDASGRYSSQLFWGNDYWLGSYTLCQQLDFDHASSDDSIPPFSAAYSVAKLRLNVSALMTPPVRFVELGLCLPASCDQDDITELLKLSEATSTSWQEGHKAAATILSVRQVPDPEYSMWREPTLYAIAVAVCLAAVLVVIGTSYDLLLQLKEKKNQKSPGAAECNGNHLTYTANGPDPEASALKTPSPEETQKKSPGMLHDLLLCFSAWSNFLKICDTRTEDSLSCIHGLRVFSLLWVIAGHSCMFAFPVSDNKKFRQLVEKDFLFQSISNGAFSVDTFFFISGVMVSYAFWKSEGKSGNKTDNAGGVPLVKKNFLQFLGAFSYRYLRLTPPYIFVLGITELVTKWFYHNSVFQPAIMVRDHANCPDFWWRNILYINTLFPVKDMCMIWSWYLANDTQFYTLGIILLLLSARYFKLAATSLFVFLVSSWFTTAVIVMYSNHTPSIEDPLGQFDELYDKPWTRLGPYVVGMCVGWLLCKTKCKIRMHKVVVVAGWALALGLTFILVHGLYGDLGPVMSAAYVALSHTAWACAIAWLVIACSTGHGGYINKLLSCKFLYPLSRITFCAYLVHPVIMFSVTMHLDSPIHLTRSAMVVVIFGYFISSYMLSLVVSLSFEAPSIALLNILHPLKKKMK